MLLLSGIVTYFFVKRRHEQELLTGGDYAPLSPFPLNHTAEIPPPVTMSQAQVAQVSCLRSN